jgi:isoleucyl-tRNA synthetase
MFCHSVILAADGRQMSKRLKNYPDPMMLAAEYGSPPPAVGSMRTGLMATAQLHR